MSFGSESMKGKSKRIKHKNKSRNQLSYGIILKKLKLGFIAVFSLARKMAPAAVKVVATWLAAVQ